MTRAASALLVSSLCGLMCAACAFDWDAVDPRAGSTSGGDPVGGAGPGPGGAGPGQGGAGTGVGGAGGVPCGELYGGAPAAAFGDISAVQELAVAGTSADDPKARVDLLELYFNSDRDGAPFQIYRATRRCVTDPWDEPKLVAPLDLGVESTSPVLSADATTMYLAYALDAVVKDFDVYVTERPSANAASWATPTLVPELSSASSDRAGWIAPDGLTIVLDSERSGSGDLYVVTRTSPTSSWSAPTPIAELNTVEQESAPTLTSDGLTIYFRRVVAGESGNIFRAERASAGDAWGVPVEVAELNTTSDDSDPWIAPDGRFLFFVRPVDGSAVIHRAIR